MYCLLHTLSFMLLLGTGISAQQLVPPSALGGDPGMRRFVQLEIQYPEAALQDKVEGTVVLLFVVNKKGNASNMRVWQSADPDLDAETIRLYNKLKWNPSQIGGSPISSEHYFRVEYSIKKYQRTCKKRRYVDLPHRMAPADSSNTVFPSDKLDEAPLMLFNDSNYSFSQFIIDNLEYPTSAFRASIEGTVLLSFVLEPSGVISNLYVKKRIGGGCSNEAMRLLRAIKWYPGVLNGKTVRTQLEFVLHFRLPTEHMPKVHSSN
jgi:TonB family protein